MPTPLTGVEELLEAPGHHPAVLGSLRVDRATLQGFRRGDAVLWWGEEPTPGALGRPVAQVGTFGPDPGVLELLQETAAGLPDRPRVTLARSASDSLPPGWSQTHAAEWDLRWLTTPPPPQPGESAAAAQDDLAGLAALLERANPDAWARPGDPAVRRWWAVRREGIPVAVAADTSRALGVGHVSSIGTDPAHRGAGFGGAVTAALLRSLLAEHGVVTLGHYAANDTARRLYDRLGMATRAQRSGLLVRRG